MEAIEMTIARLKHARNMYIKFYKSNSHQHIQYWGEQCLKIRKQLDGKTYE